MNGHMANGNGTHDVLNMAYMIPLRRCGSHAIRLRLNLSDEIFSPYPLHPIDIVNKCIIDNEALKEDENYKMLIDCVLGLEENLFLRWFDRKVSVAEMFDIVKDKPRNIHAICGELLCLASKETKPDAKIVLDKSLDCIHYAREIIHVFGDRVKFLNVVRDPRAQINSMNQAIIHEFSTLSNTQLWKDAYSKTDELIREFPRNVLTVRFEDFLLNQQAVVEKICAFFEIQFLPEMLNIKLSEEAKQIYTKSALWTSNYSHPMPENIMKFKKHLTYHDLELIETLCKDHMTRYGYELLTPGNLNIPNEEYAEAKAVHERNKAYAWKHLKEEDFEDYKARQLRNDYIAGALNKLVQANILTMK